MEITLIHTIISYFIIMSNPPEYIAHVSHGQYSNPHFVHVNTGVATEEQFNRSIRETIEFAKHHGLPHNTKYKLSMISGKKFGYGYIWFTNVQFANMLLGKNPDGSSRYEIIPWKPNPHSRLWSDIADIADPPIYRRHADPILGLMPYIMTEEQKVLAEANDIDVFTSEKGELYGTYRCVEGFTSDPTDEFHKNILFATNIPANIRDVDLKALFLPFVSSSNKEYPKVQFINSWNGNSRNVTVTFDPKTTDALFAGKMARKISFITKDAKLLLRFYLYQNRNSRNY